MPNLATASINVRESAPCHDKEVDQPPIKFSMKEDKLGHLRRLGSAVRRMWGNLQLVQIATNRKHVVLIGCST